MTAALQDMGIRTNDLEVPSGPTSVRTVVVRNPSGKIRLQNAGKYSVFGELIGRSCKESFRKVIGIPVCTMSPYDAASTFIEDAIEWGLVPEDIGNDILESMRN
ncbi:MAG: adenosylcobinamide amidohydrolase, partial [Candidatus Methanomethylophilaceae archaeon]|nr:adenosylcobinamide amidohydrolase [Candidatus Methanomethylophilaceae archaeon]